MSDLTVAAAQARCALVTGSSSGIGEAVARELIGRGWSVVGIDRTAASIQDRAFTPVVLDLADGAAIDAWFEREQLGRLTGAHAGAHTGSRLDARTDSRTIAPAVDCLVHAAGFMRTAALGQLISDDFRAMWTVHVAAAERLANALLPSMAARGYGRVVLIGSRVASGFPGRSQYAATKAALVSMARSWAAEVVSRGVTVNVVSPAATDTPMLAAGSRAGSRPVPPPIGRFIAATEVASLVGYLVSDTGAAITGQELVVCGGSSLPSATPMPLPASVSASALELSQLSSPLPARVQTGPVRPGGRAERAEAVGLVGLGLVGSALGRRLRAAGYTTLGFDVDAGTRTRFEAEGGVAADSLSSLGAGAARVFISVFDSRDVRALVDDPNGLLASGHVRTLVDCTTGDPLVSAAISDELALRGIAFIEAPWSGSSQQIDSGEATLLLAGDDGALHECAHLFEALTTRRIRVGTAGMGARAKLATNLVLGLNRAALAEGFAFAESLGLSREQFLELVLATPASSAAAQAKGHMMVTQDFTPQSRIRQHLKDVELMIESAQSGGLDLPLSQVHRALMRRAVSEGDADLDNAAIVRQWRLRGLAQP